MNNSTKEENARDSVTESEVQTTAKVENGDEKDMLTPEKEDDCCICLETLPKDPTQLIRMSCCGNGMHRHCCEDLDTMGMGESCPLCRAKTPTLKEEVAKNLRPHVKKKKAWAQTQMAQLYRDGIGVKQSYEMAKRLYTLAAQQGYACAVSDLGYMYDKGYGVAESKERAREYYEQAAHLGFAGAQNNLADMYRVGEGGTQSYEKALQLYERAIQQGHAKAMLRVGMMYILGEGVETDRMKARELWTKAAALKNEDAINFLQKLDYEDRAAAALDPNALACSMCGLPETPTRNFDNSKCPCKSAWYCNTTCQKKHWKTHRTECKRLVAEIKRKKKEKVAQRELSQSKTDAHGGTSNHAVVKEEEQSDPLLPKKGEEVNDDDGKEKTTTTQDAEKQKQKQEEDGDECPICLEELPKDDRKFTRYTCCGNGIHDHCFKDMQSMKMDGTCPFCRAKTPTSNEAAVKQVRPWVKKKKAWAQAMMGQMYRDGTGVKQSYEMAWRLYTLAGQQGDASAISNLGIMYRDGNGVEQSSAKAFEHFEQSAHLGHAESQYSLGRMYATGEGTVKNEIRAHALWTLAAAQGYEGAITMLPILEKNMTKS